MSAHLLATRAPDDPIESHGSDGATRIRQGDDGRWEIIVGYDSDQAETACDLSAVLAWVVRWHPELLAAGCMGADLSRWHPVFESPEHRFARLTAREAADGT